MCTVSNGNMIWHVWIVCSGQRVHVYSKQWQHDMACVDSV